jgi:hypothetical protein
MHRMTTNFVMSSTNMAQPAFNAKCTVRVCSCIVLKGTVYLQTLGLDKTATKVGWPPPSTLSTTAPELPRQPVVLQLATPYDTCCRPLSRKPTTHWHCSCIRTRTQAMRSAVTWSLSAEQLQSMVSGQ